MACPKSILAVLIALPLLTAGILTAADENLKVKYTWEVDVDCVQFGVEAIDQDICEWLEVHIMKCVDENNYMVISPTYPDGTWNLNVSSEKNVLSDRIASAVFTSSAYPSSAAHPMTYRNALTYDVTAGKRIAAREFFADPDKAVEIMAKNAPRLLVEFLKEEQPNRVPDDFNEEFFFEEGLAPEWENYSCLIPEKDGVRVVFQQYQVVPYVFGLPEALIPLDLLRPASPSREIWPE